MKTRRRLHNQIATMFNWRFLRQIPKFVLVFMLFMISTGTFCVWWWFFRSSAPVRQQAAAKEEARAKEVAAVVETIPTLEGNLLVADGDLYQLDTGKLLLKGWFKEAMPDKLYLDAQAGKLIGRYEKGLARFDLTGKRDRMIGMPSGVLLNDAMDTAIYAKDKDVWRGKVDFREFKLTDEQRITTTAGFVDQFFFGNIQMGTDKALIVRNMNQLVRVDLVTGSVTSIKVPLSGLREHRSPDGALLVGREGDRRSPKLAVYDVEKDEEKDYDVPGKAAASAFGWVNNQRCVFVLGGTDLCLFDREKQRVSHILDLPTPCKDFIGASPNGRYIFCQNFRAFILVDLEGKKIVPTGNVAQDYDWVGEDLLICARDVPDSNMRGTWLRKIGQEEVRISTEPYTFARRGAGGSVLGIKAADMIVFASRGGLFKMKTGETQATMFAPLPKPLTRFVYLERWR